MRALTFIVALFAMPLHAHELWIEPTDYTVSPESTLTAKLVNGEQFEGINLAFLPRNFQRFVVVSGGQFANVAGRMGDVPALDMAPIGDGLHIVAYISRPSAIDYATWEKFQKFVDHKDLGDARSAHESRDLPLEDFKELYTRYSKSLIGVGSATGADRKLGMETELVALDNPYTDDIREMRLQLHYRQEVRADEQIEIYERAPDGAVTVFLVRTDAMGIGTFPVKSGHEYMADAVVLREPTPELMETTGAVWETLWANITWAMP